MFLNEANNSPHQAWLAYLRRASAQKAELEALELEALELEGLEREGSGLEEPANGEFQLLDEEEFTRQLARLDRLILRELEQGLGPRLRTEMLQLQHSLLGEIPPEPQGGRTGEDSPASPEAPLTSDLEDLFPSVMGSHPQHHPQQEAPQSCPGWGARQRRNRWRQLRRGEGPRS